MAVTYDQAGIDYDEGGYTYNGVALASVPAVHARSTTTAAAKSESVPKVGKA